jgi:hypothetical protein
VAVALGAIVGLAVPVGLAVDVAIGVAVAVGVADETAAVACAAARLPPAQGSRTTPKDMNIMPASAIASRSQNLAGRERISFLVVNE